MRNYLSKVDITVSDSFGGRTRASEDQGSPKDCIFNAAAFCKKIFDF